jgi:hypothetical protein
MNNYAIIENGVVTNIVVWDGGDDWTPPAGSTAVLVPADTFVSIGYTSDGTTFSAPES